MPKFSYKAITDTGAATQGEIDADSVESASSLIAARGYIPTQVRGIKGSAPAVKLSGFSGLFSGIKTPELILFSKQFKTLIRSGVPMLTILQVLEDQTENKRLKLVLNATSIRTSRRAPAFTTRSGGTPTFSLRFTAAC